MRIFSCIILLSVAIGFQAALACGKNQGEGHHGKGQGMKSVIEYADANGDGAISYQEFQRAKYRYFNYKFHQMDTNRDGRLSEREFMEYHRHKGDELFKRLDGDNDGVISAEEREQAKKWWKGKHKGCGKGADE